MRRFIILLPRRLTADYGRGGPYTPTQVVATMRRHRIAGPEYGVYAMALFCDAAALEQQMGADAAAGARGDVGGVCFGGDAGFSYDDVLGVCAEASSSAAGSSESAEGGDGGGDGGGGGGD